LHLGILNKNANDFDITDDIVCDEFYKLFKNISKQNTTIYDEVFKCFPSDNVKTFQDLEEYPRLPCLSIHNPVKAKELLENKVNGLIVDFPLEFLSKEKNFFPSINTKEGLLPKEAWT
jgi:phospholipase D1/2